jgi:hypothetical protein
LRASSSINTNGIGLGLNICKTICEVFEGEISVKSAVNHGSTFTFSIKTEQNEPIALSDISISSCSPNLIIRNPTYCYEETKEQLLNSQDLSNSLIRDVDRPNHNFRSLRRNRPFNWS